MVVVFGRGGSRERESGARFGRGVDSRPAGGRGKMALPAGVAYAETAEEAGSVVCQARADVGEGADWGTLKGYGPAPHFTPR